MNSEKRWKLGDVLVMAAFMICLPVTTAADDGALLRETACGAAKGAVVDGIAGDTGKGVVAGAVGGALIGGMQRRQR